MSDKRASGISMNAIVIAIISLIVLIVTIFSMTGRFGLVSQQVEACQGTCEASCELNERSIEGTVCKEPTATCCMDIYSSQSDDTK